MVSKTLFRRLGLGDNFGPLWLCFSQFGSRFQIVGSRGIKAETDEEEIQPGEESSDYCWKRPHILNWPLIPKWSMVALPAPSQPAGNPITYRNNP
jgi:hypothetical protein